MAGNGVSGIAGGQKGLVGFLMADHGVSGLTQTLVARGATRVSIWPPADPTLATSGVRNKVGGNSGGQK